MNEKSMIIIGAGAAGLCTGIYAQMNGYQTQIFEKQNNAGGLMTTWKRNGYNIDICLHWLAGSGPGMHLYRYWNEIGLLDGRKFADIDRYAVFYDQDKREFSLYIDPDRLEKHMLELSPQDAPAIKEFIDGVRFGIRFTPPDKEQYEAGRLGWMLTIFKMMPLLGQIQKWQKTSMAELADRFKDPLLREGIAHMFTPDFSVLYALTTLGFGYKKQAGYPLGGTQPIVQFLEDRYQQAGGTIHFQAAVQKILTENGQAVGVQLEDGSQHRAEVVVSASDGFNTIYNLLDGKYLDEQVRQRYATWKPLQAHIYANFGVKGEFDRYPPVIEANIFELNRPVVIAGQEHTRLAVRFQQPDLRADQTGKTLFTVSIPTDFAYWKAFEADRPAYLNERNLIASEISQALEQIWPGISQQVEMCDVVTPLTFIRFTDNWQGSIVGWALTPTQGGVAIPKKLPGLDNFWMVGQWVYPGGGLAAGISTAREVVWRQCKKDGKQFSAGLSSINSRSL